MEVEEKGWGCGQLCPSTLLELVGSDWEGAWVLGNGGVQVDIIQLCWETSPATSTQLCWETSPAVSTQALPENISCHVLQTLPAHFSCHVHPALPLDISYHFHPALPADISCPTSSTRAQQVSGQWDQESAPNKPQQLRWDQGLGPVMTLISNPSTG